SVVVAIALALFYLQNTKPTYTSGAVLEVNQRRSDGVLPTEIESAELLKTVELKLASQSVLLAVIKQNGLHTDPEFIAPSSTFLAPDAPLVRGTVGLLESVGARSAASSVNAGAEPETTGEVLSDAE